MSKCHIVENHMHWLILKSAWVYLYLGILEEHNGSVIECETLVGRSNMGLRLTRSMVLYP